MNVSWFEAHFRIFPKPDTIVHIGAGGGRELASYRQLHGTRLVLVEPQPQLARALRSRAAAAPLVEIVECAIGPQSGFSPLNLFNLPMLSSLMQPTGLIKLLPGLRQTGQLEVPVQTLQDFLSALALPAEGEHWLLIDLPGGEASLVDALADGDMETRFSHVVLRAGVKPLYAGSRALADSLDILSAAGYRQLTAMDKDDPDWPCVHLVLDAGAAALAALEAEHAQSLSRVLKEKQHIEEEIGRLREAQASALADRQSELEKARSDLSVALRTLALRDADLDDLRERYAALSELNNRQHDVLMQLNQRLGAASDYLAQLALFEHEGAEEPGVEGLVKALTGSLDPE